MKLFVTTNTGFFIVDPEKEKYLKIVDLDQSLEIIHKPFGITWNNKNILIAKSNQIISFNKSIKFDGTYLTGLPLAIHQILFIDNSLWMVSPRTNCLIKHNVYSNTLEYFYDGKFKDHPHDGDTNHLNSILIQNNKMYVAAHNMGKTSFITVYSYPDFNKLFVYDIGRHIHNLYVENDIVFTLDSFGSRCIVSTDGKSIPVLREIDQFYIRGLAVTEDHFFVGCFHCNTLDREERMKNDSFISIVNKKTLNVDCRIYLPKSGDINDIRILDAYDYSHGILPFLTITQTNNFFAPIL